MLIEDAVSSGTPQFVIDSYATLAERAKTQSFGLIEEDVIVLDTETTGLSVQDNELIEISAARLSGREIVDQAADSRRDYRAHEHYKRRCGRCPIGRRCRGRSSRFCRRLPGDRT